VRDRDVVGEQFQPGGLRGERRERRRPDKSRGARRENRHHVGSCVHQATTELDGFVGGDPATYSEHDGGTDKRRAIA
jgi:hypothetical protein